MIKAVGFAALVFLAACSGKKDEEKIAPPETVQSPVSPVSGGSAAAPAPAAGSAAAGSAAAGSAAEAG
ncbi:MAG: hypothetical protein SFX73_11550, partial [Kofleriaceae bacterium]|nr:hypothetical protein [Kofleriaceae bacterium]